MKNALIIFLLIMLVIASCGSLFEVSGLDRMVDTANQRIGSNDFRLPVQSNGNQPVQQIYTAQPSTLNQGGVRMLMGNAPQPNSGTIEDYKAQGYTIYTNSIGNLMALAPGQQPPAGWVQVDRPFEQNVSTEANITADAANACPDATGDKLEWCKSAFRWSNGQ